MKLPSPSSVLATLALGAALAGGATAASTLITGADIKDGSIREADLSPSVRAKLSARARPGPPGPQGLSGLNGSAGPAGTAGPTGAPGATGARGGFDPAKVTTVLGPEVPVAAGGIEFDVNAFCPAGTTVISGGFFTSIAIPSRSAPLPGGVGWNVFVNNDTPVAITARAYALCAAP